MLLKVQAKSVSPYASLDSSSIPYMLSLKSVMEQQQVSHAHHNDVAMYTYVPTCLVMGPYITKCFIVGATVCLWCYEKLMTSLVPNPLPVTIIV